MTWDVGSPRSFIGRDMVVRFRCRSSHRDAHRDTPGSYFVPDSLKHTDARTVLELVIDRTGKLDPCHIRVVEETGSAWTEVVLDALREFLYSPAQRQGLPVAVRVIQPFHNVPAR